jgi:hypothetical protein
MQPTRGRTLVELIVAAGPASGVSGHLKPRKSGPAILPCERPSCLLSRTINATACGPRCVLAAPSASDVCKRVAPLHAPATVAATADMYVETTHARPDDRQISLELERHAGFGHLATAVGTAWRQRHVDRFVHLPGRLPMPVAAVPPTDTTARRLRVRCRRAFREGRGLSFACAPRPLHGLRQALNLTPQPFALARQPLAFTFQPGVVLPQPLRFFAGLIDLAPHPLQLALRVFDRLGWCALRHATVMADSLFTSQCRIIWESSSDFTMYSDDLECTPFDQHSGREARIVLGAPCSARGEGLDRPDFFSCTEKASNHPDASDVPMPVKPLL